MASKQETENVVEIENVMDEAQGIEMAIQDEGRNLRKLRELRSYFMYNTWHERTRFHTIRNIKDVKYIRSIVFFQKIHPNMSD